MCGKNICQYGMPETLILFPLPNEAVDWNFHQDNYSRSNALINADLSE